MDHGCVFMVIIHFFPLKIGNSFIVLLLFALFCCNRDEQFFLPEPVTNNAVAILKMDNKKILYSFFGLDSTKLWTGVHRKVFRVDLESGVSEFIGNVPDEFGRLASSASVINNKAYIVGGYAVHEDGTEKSSSHIFIFNPDTETFSEGTALPVSIDDQVQGVWRDSLLYVISGWSDSVNVNTVQVYNPTLNSWQLATSLPNERDAKVFGGSGIIVGDTIYMLGGAVFEKLYPPSRSFYKGAINPDDPATIQWIHAGEYPGKFRYRSAAYKNDNSIIFTGGSNETYNYNGISYDGKKPVESNTYDLIYSMLDGRFYLTSGFYPVMDLRNIACDGDTGYIAGGMTNMQIVSNRVVHFVK